MKKIIISGDRNAGIEWEKVMDLFLSTLSPDTIIIHGGCQGIDLLADRLARSRNLSIIIKLAQWDKYGKAAGPIRNKEMLKEKPDMVVLFHSNLNLSKGTRNMKELAEKANIKIIYFDHP